MLALPALSVLLSAANIGTSVPIIGTVTDLAYDSQRQLVYLANRDQNRIEVYSTSAQRLLAPLNVGTTPVSVAISHDKQTLYVANNLTPGTISVVDLNSGAIKDDIPVNSRPDSLVVGADGIVVILGSAGLLRLDAAARQVTPVPISPPAANPPGLGAGGAAPTPAGFRARLATTPDSRLIFGLSNNRVFVYEVASGAVLRSRNVTGLNASVSAAPDGNRFMVGPFLFDTQTLTILGRTGVAAQTLTGGSAFSADGNTVYATFSTQEPIYPNNPNNPQGANVTPPGLPRTLGVLQLLKSSNLAPQLGLRLPDNIVGKILLSDDGQNLFAIGNSGLLTLPIGRLNTFPIVSVEQESLLLTMDICIRSAQQVPVRIFNAGGGRMTYQAQALALAGGAGTGAPVVLSQSTGVAPGALQLAIDQRTNLARGTTLVNVQIVSPEAVNIEPTITVSVNFRDVTQIGSIFSLAGTITDLALDTARRRLYLVNNTKNQVEVFDLATQTFAPPIEVGSRPRSLALSGSNLLVVANNGSENLAVIDLDALQLVDLISMGPVSLAANPLFPSSIAASNNAILFTTVPAAPAGAAPGNGNLWQLSLATRSAFPRLNLGADPTTGATVPNVVDARAALTAPANGSSILIVTTANNVATLRLYDPTTDAIPVARPNAVQAFRGAISAAPDGSNYVVDQTVFSASLALQGTASLATGTFTQTLAAAASNTLFRVRTGTTTGANADPRNQLERLAITNLTVNQAIPMVEAVINSPFAPRGQVQDLPRAMVVDSPAGNAYLLTSSGLSIVPLALAAGRSPVFNASQVVNGASFRGPVSPGAIISIFGSDLGDQASAGSLPLPNNLGGTCLTLGDLPLPLFYVSPTQINAQLPQTTNAGNVVLSVRSRNTGRASTGVTVPVQAASPGVFTVRDNNLTIAALFRVSASGALSLVTANNKPFRDERVVLFATGLGVTTPRVAGGEASPASPLALTGPIQACIGGHRYPVEFSGLAPGFVGLYQVNLYVPGDRVQGEGLPVVLSMGANDCRNADTRTAPVTFIR
jgi:uncharacterized protein (TIGR03437 family)